MSIFSGVRFGLANTVLGWFGVAPTPWLSVTQPPWYWLVIVTVRLWLQVGFYMILFLAALQRIPPTLYEAAAIDGAVGWKVLRYITVPQLRGDVECGPAAAADQRVPGVRRVLQPALVPGQYPPYARPPLVYLYYTALGQRSGLRARQRRRGDPDADHRRGGARPGPADAVRAGGLRWPSSGGRSTRWAAAPATSCWSSAPSSSWCRSTCCYATASSTEADITSPDWTLFPSSLQWGNIAELFDSRSVPMARSLAQLARSSRSPQTVLVLAGDAGWRGTGWPGSRTAGPTSCSTRPWPRC